MAALVLRSLVLILKNLSLNLTDFIKYTASCDDVRNIHNVHIQALHQTPPPALQSYEGALDGHPGPAQSLTEMKLFICEPPCVCVALHYPAA